MDNVKSIFDMTEEESKLWSKNEIETWFKEQPFYIKFIKEEYDRVRGIEKLILDGAHYWNPYPPMMHSIAMGRDFVDQEGRTWTIKKENIENDNN